MLKQIFTELAQHYTQNLLLVEELWQEVEATYTRPKRYYHNLTHLQHLYLQLEPHRHLVQDWHTVLFSLFYHDFSYTTLKQDNEAQSAAVAVKRLQQLAIPDHKISACANHILATQGHHVSNSMDTNLFTDADLSVLGQDWEVYQQYAANIRKEYAYYPNLLYKSGRKKVLNHFLQMERIFKTSAFYELLEVQARQNMAAELNKL